MFTEFINNKFFPWVLEINYNSAKRILKDAAEGESFSLTFAELLKLQDSTSNTPLRAAYFILLLSGLKKKQYKGRVLNDANCDELRMLAQKKQININNEIGKLNKWFDYTLEENLRTFLSLIIKIAGVEYVNKIRLEIKLEEIPEQ